MIVGQLQGCMGQSNQFSIKICLKHRRTFFDTYIWTFYSDLKHNNHKEKKEY